MNQMENNINEMTCLDEKADQEIVENAKKDDLPWKEATPQVFASIVAFSMWCYVGIGGAFSAILLPQLSSESSEIPVTDQQKSWIASLLPLSTAPGSILAAYLVDILGRKAATMIQTIPLFASWTVMVFASDVGALYASRILIGIACGMAATSNMYVTEIAHPNLRGALSNISLLWASVGTLVAYTLGTLLNWRTAAIVCDVLPAVTLSLLCFVPESPRWLLSVGRKTKAEKAVRWLYKNPSSSDAQWKELTAEKINKTKDPLIKRLRSFLEPSVLKPLGVLFGFFIFQQLSGVYCFLFYTVDIFQRTKIAMDPFIATILVGVVRMCSSFLTVLISRRLGRRPMSMVSGIGMCISMLIAGTYQYVIREDTQSQTSLWITLICVLSYILFSTIGFLCLPWSMSAELLPLHARGIGGGLCNTGNHIFMFVGIKSYPYVANALQAYGLLWFFSLASFLGTVYVYFLLPETLGKTLLEIEAHFNHSKKKKEPVMNTDQSDHTL